MCSEIPRELVAWMETLTTPDSGDWTLIPDGKVIHGMAFREDHPTPAGNRTVGIGLFKISRAELKSGRAAPFNNLLLVVIRTSLGRRACNRPSVIA